MIKFLTPILVGAIASVGAAQELPAKYGTGTIVGRVVYPDGKPASGVHIAAEMQRAFQWQLVQKGAIARKPGGVYTKKAVDFIQAQNNVMALTQNDGTFRLAGLVTAPYNIKITGKPGVVYYLLGMPAQWTAPAAQGVWAKDGETRRRSSDIVLTKGALIEGQVTDQNGRPLAGIYVASEGPHRPKTGDSAAAAISDKTGHYEARVPPGSIRLYIAGPFVAMPKTEAVLDGKPQKFEDFPNVSIEAVTGKTYHLNYKLTIIADKK